MEAEAQLRGAQITYTRLQSAAATPGIVAGNELELAQHRQEALEARLQSLREMEKTIYGLWRPLTALSRNGIFILVRWWDLTGGSTRMGRFCGWNRLRSSG